MLNVLHPPALLLVILPAFLLKLLRADPPVCLERLLMVLVDTQLCQLKLAFLVFPRQHHLLLLPLLVSLILLYQGVFVLLQLQLALLILPIFLLAKQLLLLLLVLSELTLSLSL